MTSARRTPLTLDALLTTGVLVTIATGGALIGLGLREGEVSRAFRLAGRGMLERFGGAAVSAPLTSVALGYLHHLVIATLWGALCAALLLRWSGALRLLMLPLLVAGYAALSVTILPPMLRIGYAVTSSVSSVVPLGVAFAAALAGGLWVAAGEAGGTRDVPGYAG